MCLLFEKKTAPRVEKAFGQYANFLIQEFCTVAAGQLKLVPLTEGPVGVLPLWTVGLKILQCPCVGFPWVRISVAIIEILSSYSYTILEKFNQSHFEGVSLGPHLNRSLL